MKNEPISCNFSQDYNYNTFFTKSFLNPKNTILGDFLNTKGSSFKILLMIDKNINALYPHLEKQLHLYLSHFSLITNQVFTQILKDGEATKNDEQLLMDSYDLINKHYIDRHSFIIAIGGGSTIDFAGYVAATAHRGINLIRIPTTVLAQNDAAIGVKNSINFKGIKNFLGTFSPPQIVINDINFLDSLKNKDFFSGYAEAIKIALIKDPIFFKWISEHTKELKEKSIMHVKHLIFQTASLHIDHFRSSGDPFEKGNTRPLDYGHWLAHKIEYLSEFKLTHGEAVSIGLILDTTYSYKLGMLSKVHYKNIIKTINLFEIVKNFEVLNFFTEDTKLIDKSLIEFRAHLGGNLSIPMLTSIGEFISLDRIDTQVYQQVIIDLLESKNDWK